MAFIAEALAFLCPDSGMALYDATAAGVGCKHEKSSWRSLHQIAEQAILAWIRSKGFYKECDIRLSWRLV